MGCWSSTMSRDQCPPTCTRSDTIFLKDICRIPIASSATMLQCELVTIPARNDSRGGEALPKNTIACQRFQAGKRLRSEQEIPSLLLRFTMQISGTKDVVSALRMTQAEPAPRQMPTREPLHQVRSMRQPLGRFARNCWQGS